MFYIPQFMIIFDYVILHISLKEIITQFLNPKYLTYQKEIHRDIKYHKISIYAPKLKFWDHVYHYNVSKIFLINPVL